MCIALIIAVIVNSVVISVCFCFSFSEKLFMQMADRIAEDGFQKAGYKYVCIDVSAISHT